MNLRKNFRSLSDRLDPNIEYDRLDYYVAAKFDLTLEEARIMPLNVREACCIEMVRGIRERRGGEPPFHRKETALLTFLFLIGLLALGLLVWFFIDLIRML